MLTILVTGGLGFVGSHICADLINEGYKIIIIDSLKNSYKKIFNNLLIISKKSNYKSDISFFNIDINNKNQLENLFNNQLKKGNKIDAIFHFAGLKSVSESFKNPTQYWITNVGGTLNIIEMMKKFDCNYLIFSSSASVYDHRIKTKLVENDETKPNSPYGRTKLLNEILLEDLSKSFPNKFKIACLRYFNPVGAHQSYLIGEFPKLNKNNLFPNLCRVAFGEIAYLNVYGNDWDTKDGSCLRDFVHIIDIARGHIDVFNYLIKNNEGFLILNLGSGKGFSILEVIDTFEKKNKCKIPLKFLPRRIGDVSSLIADISYSKKIISWLPKLGLSEMCIDSFSWYKKVINKNF